MQHLLARAVWATDGVGADLRDYVLDHLADPAAVMMSAPFCASRTAWQRPWPRPAPVMGATLP